MALVLATALAGGGYFPAQYLAMGIGALVGAALLVAGRRAVPRLTRRAGVALVAMLVLGGWVGLSSSWSPDSALAVQGFQRQIAYAGVLVFGIVALGRGHGARGMIVAVWVALTVVAVLGVMSRLLPDLDLAPLMDDVGGYRLGWPVSYWNAQGALSVMAAILAVALAADRRTHVVVRGLAAATVPLVSTGILLTVSRGSVLALVIGAVVLVALARRPLHAAAVAVACALPSGAAIALASSRPSVVDDPMARPALADVGPTLFAELVGLGVVAAAAAIGALAFLLRIEEVRRRERERGRRRGSRWTPVVVLGAVVLVLAGLLVGASRLDGPAANRASGARSFVETQRKAFLEATPSDESGLSRLGSASGSRSDLYRVALREFGSSPVWGDGVGAFPRRWLRERRTPQPVANAHSLFLESLADTGVVGLAILLAFVGAIGWGAVVARRRPSALPRAQSAGVAGALAAFLASCAIDWTWQMGAVTAAALLLSATLLVDRRGPRGPGQSDAGRRSVGEP
ncbi:O-antigen ligase family protein [Patulibacter minatonensis]|uniref:O-antigen ligase family protein n=1 Tax=Patulibacter minatonensis TaxID=298163 RepID=UPI00047DF0B4|nr:O-antigen ligase family protein [Patulibacter minatonensis]